MNIKQQTPQTTASVNSHKQEMGIEAAGIHVLSKSETSAHYLQTPVVHGNNS